MQPSQDEIVLAEYDAPDAGDLCQVDGGNNESVHPGNTLVVTSGPNTATFEGAEEFPMQQVIVEFTADGQVVVSMRLGADGVTSFAPELVCYPPPPPPPTTTTTPTTETTVPKTTAPPPPTVTTTPPPPPPRLALTGTDGWPTAGLGLLLLVVGAALLTWRQVRN